MKIFSSSIRAVLIVMTAIVLSGCALGQAATPTVTPVDVNAVMTSAAATAFVQLTEIAAKASPTSTPTIVPSKTPTQAATATATQDQALLLLTPTGAAAGLPAVATAAATPTGAVAGLPAVTAIPSLTPFANPAGPTSVPCFNAQFVIDVTIPDGTVLKPGERFNKVWRLQNTGTCSWDEGTGLEIWNGSSMGGSNTYFSKRDNPVAPGGIVDIGVEMSAPDQPGEYIAHWAMVSDKGYVFGPDLTIKIIVSK